MEMNRMSKAWKIYQEVVIENICRYTLLVIILLAFLEVIRRYLFGDTFMWYQDVAVYGNLGLTFLYFGVALRSKAHIRLTLILEVLRRKGGRYLRITEAVEMTACALGFVICAVFVWTGIEFVSVGIDFGRTTDSAGLPLWPFYALLVYGFANMAVESVVDFSRHASNLKRLS
jgi:TRAP-type C4-dicarboxylate transport system permease small subunit